MIEVEVFSLGVSNEYAKGAKDSDIPCSQLEKLQKFGEERNIKITGEDYLKLHIEETKCADATIEETKITGVVGGEEFMATQYYYKKVEYGRPQKVIFLPRKACSFEDKEEGRNIFNELKEISIIWNEEEETC